MDEIHYQAYCSNCGFQGDSFDEWPKAHAQAEQHKEETSHAEVVVRQYSGDIACAPSKPAEGDFPLPSNDEREV